MRLESARVLLARHQGDEVLLASTMADSIFF